MGNKNTVLLHDNDVVVDDWVTNHDEKTYFDRFPLSATLKYERIKPKKFSMYCASIPRGKEDTIDQTKLDQMKEKCQVEVLQNGLTITFSGSQIVKVHYSKIQSWIYQTRAAIIHCNSDKKKGYLLVFMGKRKKVFLNTLSETATLIAENLSLIKE